MKKTLIQLIFFSTLIFFAHSTWADDIRLNFSGRLVVPACDLTVENPEQTVKLLASDKKELMSTGKSRATPFHITVTTCATATKINIRFKGQEEPLLGGALAINGAASGVAIGLESAADKPIAINTDTLTYALSGAAQERLSFNAYLLKLKDKAIEGGSFSAVANFELTYP
ncbi:type 1 fimbrial protein [Pseudomonas protegens]|uniref:Type 1 fimbrial protein n=1 Tax=Pseudomonas protegens TaxID=380021 RepID=A0A7G8YPA1_9PSED|nr:fimbrial protein [Pseudomonas protegens]QNH77499.1 type 1 fimbrial protein [Pseudomonas protegens]QNL06695.1 type 1 fimbrial protein [Pseudomonas protegens]